MSDALLEPSGPRERWNRRYGERGLRAFPDAPAQWLVENRALLSSTDGRRALDLACGDGRNAAYLAQLGFEVDAVDISDVVIAALQAAAVDRHLAVKSYRIDLERDELPALFGELDVLRYEEGVVERSGRPRAVASLVARRGVATVV